MEICKIKEKYLVGTRITCKFVELSKKMGKAFHDSLAYFKKEKITVEKCISLYEKLDEKNDSYTFVAGFLTDKIEHYKKEEANDLVLVIIPARKYCKAIHTGPYDSLAQTYIKMEEFAKEKSIKLSPVEGNVYESYLNSPEEVEEKDLLTEIVWEVLTPKK